jgi:hypothetical protein
VVVRARGISADIVTVLSPGAAAATIEDYTADGVLRCEVSRGAETDLLEWSSTTEVAWDRQRRHP